MKKGPVIALLILAVLVGIYFAIQNKPVSTVPTPYSIAAVENASRVEVVKPGDGENLVVLEKTDDVWRLTKPVDALMDEKIAKQLTEALSKKINSDDLVVPDDKHEEYDLTDDKAYKVSIYAEGASDASAEFLLGKDIRIKGTNAKRSYIKTSEGKAYRAQTELGAVLRQEASKLRSKVVLKGDRENVSEMKITKRGTPGFKFAKGDSWQIAEPADTKMSLEMSQVNTLVANFASLQAIAFHDDKSPGELGLDPPDYVVGAKTPNAVTLHVGNPEKDKFYVQKPGDKAIYEITKNAGRILTSDILDFRNRIEKKFIKDQLTEIAFAGEEGVVVKKEGEAWVITKPKKVTVDDAKIQPRVGTFTGLRANTYHAISLEEAGLDKPLGKITFTVDGNKHTFLIGNKEIDDRGTRYGKWEDSEHIMSISQFVTDRATAKVADLEKAGS